VWRPVYPDKVESKIATSKDKILGEQLGSLTISNYGEQPEHDYYAVNALRLVIEGFNKSGDGPRMTQARHDELKAKYGRPRRWCECSQGRMIAGRGEQPIIS